MSHGPFRAVSPDHAGALHPYDLVMEVTIRETDGIAEPKREYLLRIMQAGSSRARTLKLADRINNLTSLGFVHKLDFIRRGIEETELYLLPYAAEVNADMAVELSDRWPIAADCYRANNSVRFDRA